MLREPACYGVAGFVICNSSALLLALGQFALDTTYNTLGRHLKVTDLDTFRITTCCNDGTFVDYIHNVGSRETWRESSQFTSVVGLGQLRVCRHFLKVNIENLLSLLDRRQYNFNLSVKAARA